MSDKRYGVIPIQDNGWSHPGFTADELMQLIHDSEYEDSAIEAITHDIAILPALLKDLIGAASGYSSFPEAAA